MSSRTENVYSKLSTKLVLTRVRCLFANPHVKASQGERFLQSKTAVAATALATGLAEVATSVELPRSATLVAQS